MKLICEQAEEIKYLVEEKEGKKKMYITGIFLQSEQKNRNGRVYPRAVMEQALENYADKVTKRLAYGELGHPSGPKINEDRISHLIESLKWDGNNVIGRARVLDTTMGLNAQKIMEGGGSLGVSSRGLGSLKEIAGINEVQNDFRIATAADIVIDPSGPNCFVNGIMEDVEFYLDSVKGTWMESHIEKVQRKMKKMSVHEINEKKLKIFEAYLGAISTKR
jgi:hypothetical protein